MALRRLPFAVFPNELPKSRGQNGFWVMGSSRGWFDPTTQGKPAEWTRMSNEIEQTH
jgi:hypothetical protein